MRKIVLMPKCHRCGQPAAYSTPMPGGYTKHECSECMMIRMNNPTQAQQDGELLKRLGLIE